MVKEAGANAETDKAARDLAELKNKTEQLCYQTEKSLKEAGDKVSEGDRQRIEEKIAEARKAAAQDDSEAIQTAFTALEAESHQLAEQLYKEAGAAQPEGEEPTAGVGAEKAGGEGGEGDVIDAEFKEEK
jgi:molecular chaperone DnaK